MAIGDGTVFATALPFSFYFSNHQRHHYFIVLFSQPHQIFLADVLFIFISRFHPRRKQQRGKAPPAGTTTQKDKRSQKHPSSEQRAFSDEANQHQPPKNQQQRALLRHTQEATFQVLATCRVGRPLLLRLLLNPLHSVVSSDRPLSPSLCAGDRILYRRKS